MASIYNNIDEADQANGDNSEESCEQYSLAPIHTDYYLDTPGPDRDTNKNSKGTLSLVYIDHDDIQSPNTSRDRVKPMKPIRALDAAFPRLTAVYLDHDCDSIYNAKGSSIPSQPPTSLFNLPAEVRLMIWKSLLPKRRIFQARGRFGRLCRTSPHVEFRFQKRQPMPPRQWIFEFQGPVSQPVLSQTCRESRDFLLRHGAFIFQTSDEGGF